MDKYIIFSATILSLILIILLSIYIKEINAQEKAFESTTDPSSSTSTTAAAPAALPTEYKYEPYLTLSGLNYEEIMGSSRLQLTHFSIASWFKTSTDFSSEAYIVNRAGSSSETTGKNMNYGIYMTNSGKIKAGFETKSGKNYFVTTSNAYNDDLWHYAVVTYDGSAIMLYIDGVRVESRSATATPDNSGNHPVSIGADSLSQDGYFVGSIDEVRIWDRALTSSEIADIYKHAEFVASGQIAHLSFDALVGTFYYPWYGKYKHWQNDDHKPPKTWASNYLPDIDPAKFDPSNELYDSRESAIILMQLAWMKKAGINFAISSWWGQHTYQDNAFANIITNIMTNKSNPYPDLKWTLYYEPEGYDDPSLKQIVGDLNYIKAKYTSSPYYLKINGKPVIFVYNTDSGTTDPLQEVKRWKKARDLTGFYVILKVDPLSKGADPKSVDSWHQYVPSSRYDEQKPWSASISPGFWKFHESSRLARNIDDFEAAVEKLAASNVRFKLVETWNEWSEGTGVEPAQKVIHDDLNGFAPAEESYGHIYLEILGKYFGNISSSMTRE